MDDSFGYWLSGYIDGEGSFNANVYKSLCVQMTLLARADEFPTLKECRDQTGLGSLYYRPAPGSSGTKPQWVWVVQRKADCLALVELLEKYPLRAKKSQDFKIWSQIVRIWNSTRAIEQITELCGTLREARRYTPVYER